MDFLLHINFTLKCRHSGASVYLFAVRDPIFRTEKGIQSLAFFFTAPLKI